MFEAGFVRFVLAHLLTTFTARTPVSEVTVVTTPRKKILILDTDAELLVRLERLLEDAGWETTTTWDAQVGQSLFASGGFDLLLVGEHPPEISCSQVLKDVQVRNPRTPCIVLQRVLRHPFETQYLCSLGATAVVFKWDLNEVLNKVTSCLRRESERAKDAVPGARAGAA